MSHPLISPNRYAQANTFISTAAPALELTLVDAFQYIGSVAFDLKSIAHVERHIFLDPFNTRVRRQFILQFEGFLPHTTNTYHFPLNHPIQLADTTFTLDNYFFSNAADIASSPDAEIGQTNRFLASKGYHVEDEQMTARFARPVGADQRSELIMFYHENIRDTGFTLSQIADANDEILKPYAEIAQALTQRALASFRLLRYDDA